MVQFVDPKVVHLEFTMEEASVLEHRLRHIKLGDIHFTETDHLSRILRDVTEAIKIAKDNQNKTSV